MKDYSPAEKKRGLKISLGIMFLVALACSLIVQLHRPAQPVDPYLRGATGRWIGETLGIAISAFLFGLVFFVLVRLMRWADVPRAGLITGLIAVLIWCGVLYYHASLQLSGAIPS